MSTIHQNFISGTLSANITDVATSLSGSALSSMSVVASPDTMFLVLDPDGSAGAPEIVTVTAHTTSSTSATVTRAAQSTTARAHLSGVAFRVAVTKSDLDQLPFRLLTTRGDTLIATAANTAARLAVGTAGQAYTTDGTDVSWGQVAAAGIASDAVTTAKILDSNVTTGKIADSAVTSAKIADGTIVAGDLADGAVTSAKILDGTIATGDIADSAITSAKIADGTIVAGDIATGAVTSTNILDGTIATGDLADGAVTSAKIADGTIVAGDLADGAVTSAKILDGTIVAADLSAAVLALLQPSGLISPYGGSSAPTGWLLCDGTAVSRSTYSALFAVTSTSFGAGDGSTTFNLPDLRGRAPIGSGTGSGLTARTLGALVGEETHLLTGAESGTSVHNHLQDPHAHYNQTTGTLSLGGSQPKPGSTAGTDSAATAVNQNSVAADASSAHNNMQPSQVTNFIIKT